MSQLILPGTASPSDVLTGKTFSAGTRNAEPGTMPNRGQWNATPGTNAITIPAGYHNGTGTVAGVTVPADKVLSGTTIAGTAGAMPNRGALSITPSASPQSFGAGYYSSVTATAGYAIGQTIPATTLGMFWITEKMIMLPEKVSGVKFVAAQDWRGIDFSNNAVHKLDETGKSIWKWYLGTINSWDVDSNGVTYVATGTNILRRISPSGGTTHSEAVGSGDPVNKMVKAVPDGSAVYFRIDQYVYRRNGADLTPAWTYNAANNNIVDIEVDNEGNLYCSGYLFTGVRKINTAGVHVWTSEAPGDSIGVTMYFDKVSGNFYVMKGNGTSSSSYTLYNVDKSNGKTIWSVVVGSGWQTILGVDPYDGYLYISGETDGIKRISPSGVKDTMVWAMKRTWSYGFFNGAIYFIDSTSTPSHLIKALPRFSLK